MFADSNPYESSTRKGPDNPQPQGRRFVLLSLGAGVAGFLAWCILDVVTVRVLPYPERVGDFDWTLGVLSLAFLGYAVRYFRSAEIGNGILLALESLILSTFLTAVLVILFGIPFHFAIGGKL